MSLAKKRELEQLRKDATRARPSRMPGVRTSYTTNGTRITPIFDQQPTTQTTQPAPRWG